MNEPTAFPSSSVTPAEEEHRHRHRPRSRYTASRAMFWILALLLVAIPAVRLPNSGAMLGVKAFAMEAVGILLAAMIFSRGEWTRARTWAALTAPPNVAILGFLVWVGVSAARSDFPGFSRAEAMRHLGGGLIYFSVVYGLSLRRHMSQFLTVVLLAGSVGAVMAFLNYGETATSRLSGAFRNEQLLAGFLCILFPIVLVTALKEEEPWRKLAAQVVIVVLSAGILVSQNRSVWAGTALALVVLGLLFRRFGGQRFVVQKHQVIVPAVMIVLAGGLFFYLSHTGSAVFSRVNTFTGLSEDATLRWRRAMWDKAWRMTLKKPVFGWGVGTYPINQALFFHPDAPFRTQREIMDSGSNLNDNAHNTYLQLAAETGITGLALYLGIFGTFFVTALRAAGRIRPGLRQGILFASTAAILAQMVSAVGSPAWEFPECSLFLWMVLGLGMAAAGLGDAGRDSRELAREDEN